MVVATACVAVVAVVVLTSDDTRTALNADNRDLRRRGLLLFDAVTLLTVVARLQIVDSVDVLSDNTALDTEEFGLGSVEQMLLAHGVSSLSEMGQ